MINLKKKAASEGPLFSPMEILLMTVAFLVIIFCVAGLMLDSNESTLHSALTRSKDTQMPKSAVLLSKDDIDGNGW